MDSKYYSLVEIIAFAAFALGFCVYQIWTVRRKPGDDAPKSREPSNAKNQDAPNEYLASHRSRQPVVKFCKCEANSFALKPPENVGTAR